MEAKRLSSAVFFGVATIFVIAFITSLIFSLILKFTSVEEASIKWMLIAISMIAVFIGGFTSGGKGGSKGWLAGGVTGIVYIVIVFLLQFLGYDQTFTTQQIIFHSAFLGTAVLGGIIGVNIAGNTRQA